MNRLSFIKVKPPQKIGVSLHNFQPPQCPPSAHVYKPGDFQDRPFPDTFVNYVTLQSICPKVLILYYITKKAALSDGQTTPIGL
jgi:hypothetical protein